MEFEFLTLLNDYNGWLDWVTGRFDEEDDGEAGPEPKKFPCFVGEETTGWTDDGEGQPLFSVIFLYSEDLEKMLEALS